MIVGGGIIGSAIAFELLSADPKLRVAILDRQHPGREASWAGLSACLSQPRDNGHDMGRLIYSMNVSLDGDVAAPGGDLSWTTIDEEIHTWWNDRMREAAAVVWGRRVYELTRQGERAPSQHTSQSPVSR